MHKSKGILNEFIVTLIFFLSRLPLLGYDYFNTDVWKWKARTYDFSSGIFFLDFAKTLQKYHPGVILMWIGTVAIKLQGLYYEVILKKELVDNTISQIFSLHFFQKLLVVAVTAITVGFIYYAIKNSISRKYAALVTLFLLIEPFYIALNRVYHLEGLMSTFMIASFVWLFYYFNGAPQKNRLIISAVFSSLAFLTKSSALFMIPFTGLILFLNYYQKKKILSDTFKIILPKFFYWLGVSLLVYFILWPALWVQPIFVLETLYRGIFEVGVDTGHDQIFFGRYVMDPGILFYPAVLLYRTSVFLIPGVLGYLLFARKSFSTNSKKFALYSLIFAFFYFVELSLSSKKLDRYFIPSILSLTFVSAFFYQWFIDKFKLLGKFVFASAIAVWLVFLMVLHPDYFSYYSPFGGGLKKGVIAIEPKWMIGQQEIIEFFENAGQKEGLEKFSSEESLYNLNKRLLQNKLVVAFPEKYYTQIWPFIRKEGGWAVIEDLTAESQNAYFFVYPVWDDYSNEELRFEFEYYGSIDKGDVRLYNVYKKLPLK